jgi:hypothetical protein
LRSPSPVAGLSLPLRLLRSMKCVWCVNSGWVCESHLERPWQGRHACSCGAAGAPCPICNMPEEGAAPRMPDGFKTEVDKKGWRH